MANKNCLEGIACPKCLQEEVFKIEATSTFSVTDDGAEQEGDIEWDDDSFCRCPKCGYTESLAHFKVESIMAEFGLTEKEWIKMPEADRLRFADTAVKVNA